MLIGAKEELEAGKPNLIKDFELAGNDISNGLIKGIEEQTENNKPWYKKIWDSVIGWFKNIFGIKSPSTVFEGFGVNIMEGLG